MSASMNTIIIELQKEVKHLNAQIKVAEFLADEGTDPQRELLYSAYRVNKEQYFKAVDAVIDANEDKDFGGYRTKKFLEERDKLVTEHTIHTNYVSDKTILPPCIYKIMGEYYKHGNKAKFIKALKDNDELQIKLSEIQTLLSSN